MTNAIKFSEERAYNNKVSLADSTEKLFHKFDDCRRIRNVRSARTKSPKTTSVNLLCFGRRGVCTSVSLAHKAALFVVTCWAIL